MIISGSTKVYALFGNPVTHSRSPLMQNTAFRMLKIDAVYLPFLVNRDGLADAVKAIRVLNLGGVNLTIPHKESVFPYLDEVDEEARMIGAVNTVVNRDGYLCGYNTDAPGFLVSLKRAGFDLKGKRVVLMGAGGAARAVAVALVLHGVSKIHICDINTKRGEILAHDLCRAGAGTGTDTIARAETRNEVGSKTGAGSGSGSEAKTRAGVGSGSDSVTGVGTGAVAVIDLSDDGISFSEALRNADLLVNATPVGMYPHHQEKPIVRREQLHPGLLVCDLVYNPLQTRLLEEAAAAGCGVLNGVGMLAHQGALAFQLWTGRKAPVDSMERAVLEALQRKTDS